MRSHAKASSPRSNTRRASGLGRVARGALAILPSAPGADGSPALSARPSSARARIAALALALAALALLAPSALAHQTRFETGSFGPDGTSATNFSSPSQLAADQANDRLYVLDTSGPEIYSFDTPGLAPTGSPFPLTGLASAGSWPDLAVDNSTSDEVQTITVTAASGSFTVTYGASTSGDLAAATATPSDVQTAINGLSSVTSAGGSVTVGGSVGSYTVTFDGGSFAGKPVAVSAASSGGDPLVGGTVTVTTTHAASGIYYLSQDSSGLYGFDAANGASVTGFPVTGFSDPCGDGVDPSGNVWVGDFNTKSIQEYSSAGAPIGTPVDTSAQGRPCHVAFDSNGDMFVTLDNSSAFVTWKYTAPAYTTATQIDSADTSAIAVDRSAHTFYVAHSDKVSAYNASSGAFLYDFASSIPGESLSGVAVDEGADRVYVSDAGSGKVVRAFGPAVTLPDVTTGGVDGATATSAVLHGTVNPNGLNVTDCHFEYTSVADFQANGFANATHVACSPDPGGGGSDIAVSATATGLSVMVDYKFRLVAANANGAAQGAAADLRIGPRVDSSSIEWNSITATAATLDAQINPNSQGTSYHVEYVTKDDFDSSGFAGAQIGPAPVTGIGHGSSDVSVSPQLTGLTPNVAYVARFVATNPSGTVYGSDLDFTTYAGSGSFGACSNDPLRTGFGAALPDCRAYEQASPVNKGGGDAQGQLHDVEASTTGDAITFVSHTGIPLGDSSVGSAYWPFYIAQRGAGGWSSSGLLPPAAMGSRPGVAGWTPDLAYTYTYVTDSYAPQGKAPAFVERDSATGAYSQIHTYASGAFTNRSDLAGASSDGSKVYFENNNLALTPDATAGKINLYVFDRATNTIKLAGVLPDSACGTPPCPAAGSFAAPWNWANNNLTQGGVAVANLGTYTQYNHVVSDSGDQIFFGTPGAGQLYLRKNAAGPSPSTDWVNQTERTPADPNGTQPAVFATATPSGSKAFFTSCEKLTNDSTAHSIGPKCNGVVAGEGPDLYAYESSTGALSDLTVDGSDPEGADVQGVLGASSDGDYVYFAANGVLAPGATLGNCQKENGYNYFGTCNLYLWHAGAVSFITTLDSHLGDIDWSPSKAATQAVGGGSDPLESRVSSDGKTLLFGSVTRQTAYDNQGMKEFYRFHLGDPLVCVSCSPTGAPPAGNARLDDIATGAAVGVPQDGTVITRNLSADGDRIFFESSDKLVAADTNGDQGCSFGSCQDVYEWEAAGSGSCDQASAAYVPGKHGCIYLLSTGTSTSPSFFGDASVSGDDAFIFTRSQLVPQDGDGLQDAYDLRVGGGLPSQHASPPPACTGDTCRGQGTAPPAGLSSGSAAFSGPGNQGKGHRAKAKKCKKGKRGRKCLKHGSRHRSANADGRAGK